MEQTKPDNLVETTDCLEAVGVFRGWKNFLFIVLMLCLLLLQVSFWLVSTGYVKACAAAEGDAPSPAVKATSEPNEVVLEGIVIEPDEVREAVRRVVADQNLPAAGESEEAEQRWRLWFRLKFEQLKWLVRFLDFVVILAGALYCLTMLFALKISLLGRLGGINHICRAFFLSLTLLVLLLPWQKFFGGAVKGALYLPAELETWMNWYGAETSGVFEGVLYYLRFTGYWVVVVLLLIFSQMRSNRWAKAILRRLEVI